MPPTEISVRLNFDFPEELLAHYENQAKEQAKSLESVILERLKTCKGHTAQRPLYFNDAQRAELEIVLGGRLIRFPDELLKLLRDRMTFSIAGQAISLDAELMEAIRIRSEEIAEPPRDIIVRGAVRGVRQEVWVE